MSRIEFIDRERHCHIDGGGTCVHPMRDDEPDGYTSWHIWAPKNLKGRAKACQTPGCVIAVHVGDKPSRFIPKALP